MSLPDNEAMHVLSPSVFAHRLTSLGRTVFQDNRIEAICPEKPVPTASPTKLSPSVCTPHTVFRHIRRDVICPENPCAQLCAFSLYCFLQTELSPSYFPQCPFRPQTISHGFPSVHPFIASVSLLPLGALPKLFPTVSLPSTLSSFPYRSFPPELSPSYFPRFRKLFTRFPLRPACCLAPSQRSSPKLFPRFPVRPALSRSQRSFPQAICTVSSPSSMLSRSLPKLFARFPVRSACCLAPSQRSSPQAICTVSSPSSMLSRSLPAKLPPSYFHGFLSVQHAVSLPPSEALRKLFARFPVRPALSRSQRSFPQAICTVSSPSSMLSRSLPELFARFPVRSACCLAPSQRSSPQAICTVSSPSSMLSRSLPAKLPPSYFHGFLSVQHAVSLPPSEALRKLFPPFPVRPALSRSQRSFPQAICTVSSPSSMLSRSLPKLFARFPVRSACCLAPSQRSSPQAICTVSSPSSMLSRSLPAKLSASYLHGFQSVQHAVSLPPSEALHKLFPPFPVRPACCLAPSQRSSPQAICTVSSPSSMLSRSLPAKLSPSYLHGFQRRLSDLIGP